MGENRTAIPASLKRDILVEAGHRCAIPTCKQTPVEIAHIIPWKECQEHTFENLIALCPTCHTRFDRGDIDKKCMFIYKRNLGVINNRYGDLEQRVLKLFSENEHVSKIWLPGGLDIMLLYLLQDGIIIDTGCDSGILLAGMPSEKLYQLTDKGRNFIKQWLLPEEIK